MPTRKQPFNAMVPQVTPAKPSREERLASYMRNFGKEEIVIKLIAVVDKIEALEFEIKKLKRKV